MTDSKGDQRRFQNLTQEQVETLDQVLTEVIPIHGRGNFPTLEVKPKDIIHVVRDKLVAKEIKVRDVRLNGSTASHVLVKENGTSYKDLDIIFGVELPKQEDFQIIKEVVLSCLLDFLPQGVNKDKITALTMKEAYVQKMVKVFTEHDRWSLISLSNNSGKNVELKFVNSLRRQFEFSVDSFQIILDRMLESYLEAERRQATEAQRILNAAAAASTDTNTTKSDATLASASVASNPENSSLPPNCSKTMPISPSQPPMTEAQAQEHHPPSPEAPPPSELLTDHTTDAALLSEPPCLTDSPTSQATECETMVVENGVSDGTSLSDGESMHEDSGPCCEEKAVPKPTRPGVCHEEKTGKKKKEEEVAEEEEVVEEEPVEQEPQKQCQLCPANSQQEPSSCKSKPAPMEDTARMLIDSTHNPDTLSRPSSSPDAATEDDPETTANAVKRKVVEEEGQRESEEKEEKEAQKFLTENTAEAESCIERLSDTEASCASEDRECKSDIACEPMELEEEGSLKKGKAPNATPLSLPSQSSLPSSCPFSTQSTVDSLPEYPLPPPAKKNTRSSQMVVLKHSSPKPPRKMSKKVTSVPKGPVKGIPNNPTTPLPISPPLALPQQQPDVPAPAIAPCNLLSPPRVDPTESIPMQVESTGILATRSEPPPCASGNQSSLSPLPLIGPPSLPESDVSISTSAVLSTVTPQDSLLTVEEKDTHLNNLSDESPLPTAAQSDQHSHTQTSIHSHEHVHTSIPTEREMMVRAETSLVETTAERHQSLQRDQNTQTEPLTQEEILPLDISKPIIQVNSLPFVQVDETLSDAGLKTLASQREQGFAPEVPVNGSPEQIDPGPMVTVLSDPTDVCPPLDTPELGQPQMVQPLHTLDELEEPPSEVSVTVFSQPQMTHMPQTEPPQFTCEVTSLAMPSGSLIAMMPQPVTEMPEMNSPWLLATSDPVAMVTDIPTNITPVTSSPSTPPPPSPYSFPPPAPYVPASALPAREVPKVTVVAESMYGDFEQAMDHLRYRLIATRNPEEIRGGGLLKYSNLLVREFKPASETEIKTLERYMCSRFFIDFPDVNEQQRKIESYLRNHFIGEEKSKYDYLMTLRRVIDESTVCLMGHERRQTLNMITILALKVLGEQNIIPNTNNVTCFYQPAPYMTDHNFSNYYIANGQSPVIYHPYPLHIHMQTGLV